MSKEEFIALIGQDVVVDYNFCGELQQWSMKNFSIKDGIIRFSLFINFKILEITKQLITNAIIFTIKAEYNEKCPPKNKVAKCTSV